ncbi:MAG: hypothetical protein RR394_05320 [Oscillospiraceae bacterium]
MKYSKLELNGIIYPLIFNGNAKFELEELYDGEFIEKMNPMNKDGFSVLAHAVAIMSQQAELCRKYEGYDCGKVLSSEEIELLTLPNAIPSIYTAAVGCVLNGMGISSEGEDDCVDLGLEELNKKKE